MIGFNSEFKNLKDYILKITYRIWEERGVESIRDFYGENVIVKTPTSVTDNLEEVIISTYKTLEMFPDRQLFGEDVIGSEKEKGTFYSSHRILSTATHLGKGFYGPPTQSKLTYRVFADCICKENRIIDEWMVRDQSAIVKQIGLNPRQFGQQLALNQKNIIGKVPNSEEYIERWKGLDYSVPPSGIVKILSETYKNVWEKSEFDSLKQSHNRACQIYVPGGEILYGHNEFTNFLQGYLKSFPKGSFKIHHWIVNEEEGKNTRIAFRWSYYANHSGAGFFEDPKGEPVIIMAITHAELQENLVVREYLAIDEISIWMQIFNQN
tara:strand:+ start:1049 stop:2017 length:969 start_codon:yes stop_codon:yes gene_type:complete